MSKQVNVGASRKLNDAYTEGESTLRSDSRILLRQTEKSIPSSKLGPKLPVSRDEDSNSTTTTTSDVNSDDDAASIVSRLSQIVVEQEGKLGNCAPAELLNGFQPSDERSTGKQIGAEGGLRRGPNQLRPGCRMSRVRSSTCVLNQQAPEGGLEPSPQRPSPQHSGSAPVRTERRKFSTGNSPAILVSSSTKNAQEPARLVRETRPRTKSVVAGEPEGLTEPIIRRNESSGFLPERGDLKQLELSRNSQPVGRLRSNTAGSADKSALLGNSSQLILNIRRSAWTLPEFDRTFNKSSERSAENSPTGEPILDKSTKIEICEPRGLESGKNVNLLIRASKNAMSQQNLNDSANTTGSPSPANSRQPTPNNDRRSSQSHSIVSLASSLDSFYSGLNKSVGRGLTHQKRKRKEGAGSELEESCLKSCFNMETFSQYLPVLEWLPAYKLSFLWGDVMAGIAVAVLNISTSLSAAVVAETDLSVAFRASIVNTFVYAMLCSSKHTSFGSWSIMSQMLLVSVQKALSDELLLNRLNLGPSTSWEPSQYSQWHLEIIIMYTFLIGLVQLVSGLLNLGNILASFIPEPLCSSMIAATAFTMAVGQLANMCGTTNKILWSVERNTTDLLADLKNPPVDITDLFHGLFVWIQQVLLLAKHHEQINVVCAIISAASVILLFLNQYVIQRQLERLFKRKMFIPFEMILLVVMILVSYSLGLTENYKVPTCGSIKIELVLPSLPNLKLIRELWFQSLATALISYTMVYIMAKTYSNKLNYEVDCNQELIACGAGNLIGGLFDALPATASFSRTSIQVEAGGSTQMASIVNCIILILLAQLFGHHVSVLPVCVMAATLFYGFVRMMMRFTDALKYWRVCKVDFSIWLVTFVAILTMDMVNGFVYGFIFSVLTMLYRAQNRRCYMLGCIGGSDVYVPLVKYPLAQDIEGVKIFQFCGPIHYVCADLFERLLRQKTKVNVKHILRQMHHQEVVKFKPRDLNLPTHIILDFSMISYIDSAGVHVIKKIIEDYNSINVTILLASLASHVAAVVKSEPSLWNTYKERFYVTLSDAVHCAMRDNQRVLLKKTINPASDS